MIRSAARKDHGTRKLRCPFIRGVVAANLLQARWNKRLTQAELGASLGVSQQTIEALEKGRKMASVEAAYLLAARLGVEFGDLCKRGGVPATRGKPPKDLRTTGKRHLQ